MKRGRSRSEEEPPSSSSSASLSAAAVFFATSSTGSGVAQQERRIDNRNISSRSLLSSSLSSLPSESQSQTLLSATGTPKKARSTNYEVPRSVKPSILTAMGTLSDNISSNIGGVTSGVGIQGYLTPSLTSNNSNNNNTFVPMRRRLSGGKVDQYIGRDQDNNMDGMDIDANRPRSMSF